MMLGARTGAWAKSGGGVPTARDYVQDGLLVLYDGIENVGWGEHDGTASAWVDLVGTLDPAQYKSGTVIGDDCAYNPIGTQIATNSALKTLKGIVCPCYEIVMSVNSLDIQSGLTRILDLKKDDWFGQVAGDVEKVGIGFGNFIADNVVGKSYDGVEVSTYYISPLDVDWTSTNSYSLCHFVDASISNNGNQWNSWDKYHPTDMPLALVNGVRKSVKSTYFYGDRYINSFTIGANTRNSNSEYLFRGRIHCIRVYGRYLTDDERLANYAVDKTRFNLPQTT